MDHGSYGTVRSQFLPCFSGSLGVEVPVAELFKRWLSMLWRPRACSARAECSVGLAYAGHAARHPWHLQHPGASAEERVQ